MAKKPTRKAKPKKPYSDFSLTAHRNGPWCRKILGKLHFFGTDADAALRQYLDERDDLQAGRRPASRYGRTVADLCNRYREFTEFLVASDELSPRIFYQSLRCCRLITEQLGRTRLVEDVRPEDFAKRRATFADGRGGHALSGLIRGTRMVFLFAQDEGLTEKHVRFGKTFKPPPRKPLRRSRRATQQEHGKRMFEASELQTIIKACGVHMRAMVHLGINCGFGQTDCAALPLSAVDLTHGVVEFPRPKTEAERRCFLWPESVASLRQSLESRPEFDNDRHPDLLFPTGWPSSTGHWSGRSVGPAFTPATAARSLTPTMPARRGREWKSACPHHPARRIVRTGREKHAAQPFLTSGVRSALIARMGKTG